jgi:hypothetical protein
VEAAGDTWSDTSPPDGAAGTAATAAPVAATVDSGAAPVEERYAGATPAPVSGGAGATGPANDMLALNRTGEPGVWAYYAEHYAKIRGCEIAGEGAVLEDKKPEFELHRVYCESGQSFLVKCNAGTCRGMQ